MSHFYLYAHLDLDEKFIRTAPIGHYHEGENAMERMITHCELQQDTDIYFSIFSDVVDEEYVTNSYQELIDLAKGEKK
jgi:hypothetical protein